MRGVVHQISIPNPFFEGRNSVYVIVSDPVTLIDTGVATAKAFQALQSELSRHGLTTGDVRRVILTHKHIDHIGNAWRFQRGNIEHAEILIHESERRSVEDVDPLVRDRCGELVQHHRERLEKTVAILDDGPRTVYEVARALFGRLEDFHIVLGCAEANAHLEYLADRGQVISEDHRYRLA